MATSVRFLTVEESAVKELDTEVGDVLCVGKPEQGH
jgi:hypothetical protein